MRALLLTLALLAPAPACAQAWNSDSALALVGRAIARRSRAAADTSLRDYKAQAHGFLFFLGQFGEGLREPPRLIKADQLELEVYWKAPGASKQRIAGWRDHADFPTDIVYHRDHLGIVQNNFGRTIRLGEGDEVRDVPHPLSPGALVLYDYALGDTLRIALPGGGRVVRVVTVRVRPKDFAAPRVVGTLYLDLATAELVRLTVNFTPRAYLDRDLEDVSIVLDNGLWEERWWLPVRQEIEIRRRATWLDLPARGIIRGRWEIDNYQFNLGLVDSWFVGEEITALPKAERDSFPWTQPLAAAIQGVAEPVRESDLEAIRAQAERIAGRHALTGLRRAALGARSISDLVHSNRVEGLTPGAGLVWRRGDRVELRARAAYGFAARRVTGAARVTAGAGPDAFELRGFREVRDVADEPVIAPFLNSVAAQEFGADYGDYYLADGGALTWRHALGPRGEAWGGVGREWIGALPLRAAPASGTFRPNPPLGDGGVDLLRLGVRRESEGFAVRHDRFAELTVEAGRRDGGATYVRLNAAGHVLLPIGDGASRLLLRVQGGASGGALPPHRAFVLGGRGTLLGDSFRAWGGSRALLAHVELRLPVGLGGLRLGAARIPTTLTVAPYAAAGWTGDPVAGTPWAAAPGTRVTLGAALEWLGVFRLEAGYGLERRRASVAFDVTRDFWAIL